MQSYLPALSMREAARLPAAALRRAFVPGPLFKPGRVLLHYWETERTIVGGAMPKGSTLTLHAPPELRAAHFNDRRELGVVNLGGPGTIVVDGRRFAMGHLDSLYVGRGAKRVTFASKSGKAPARYYLLSYPAHAAHPTRQIKRSDLQPRVLGSAEAENHRILHQVIHPGNLPTCQLVMGFTLVQPGSKWNTMPPHTHLRRSEVYCYFGFPRGGDVKHFLGHPSKVRTLRLGEGEAILSPPWSLHSGEGSSHYGFVWGMGGENQDYADMDPVDPKLIHRAR
jgi:4-deoxy-L-threo-5-hexosulose-uronate ketol-isomerase